ncbi:MAG: GLPGLI family protein [Arcticibacter sp.]
MMAALLLLGVSGMAQHARFVGEGVIEYEKKINMYAKIKKRINKENEMYMSKVYDQFVKNQPQFTTVKSNLVFTAAKSLYTPVVVTVNAQNSAFGMDPNGNQPNQVFTDFSSGMSTIQKSIFEETYLVKDSMRQITWKLTGETREIAGYQCRRANGLMLDSVYVVAFYSEEIPVSGGPESFGGLPGMILGVAIPYENVTWFATQVFDKTVDKAAIKAPQKGKLMTFSDLKKRLNELVKRWGDEARTMLFDYLI